MNYIEINTELTGKIIGFTQTISKQHIFDNNLTIDEVLVSEKYCDNPTVTVYPVRTGKILKCYVTANSSSYQIYSVLIFDVVRFVFSNDLIFLPNPPIVVGDEYMWDSKNYTVAKIYSHKLLIEREDDVQLITHRFKPKITKDVIYEASTYQFWC